MGHRGRVEIGADAGFFQAMREPCVTAGHGDETRALGQHALKLTGAFLGVGKPDQTYPERPLSQSGPGLHYELTGLPGGKARRRNEWQ
ncbi:MAG: hypothetical protein QGI33_02020, partial [Candidatus Brocadiia bacterium]|nr:hypothetical protein [Candidatus Brocadiia bacterium]